MKRIAFLFTLIIAVPFLASSQPALAIFSSSITPASDTLSFGTSYDLNFEIVNTGNSQFDGIIKVEYAINNNFPGTLDSLNTNVLLDTGQILPVTIQGVPVLQPDYSVGDNIVVIWPVAVNVIAPTTDSGQYHIYVDTALGVGSPRLRDQIKAWYVPQNKELQIVYGDLAHEIDKITLYNLTGQTLISFPEAKTKISLRKFPDQLYFLRIQTKDGESICFKILRQ